MIDINKESISMTEVEKLRLACRLVLLFHSGSHWDDQKREEWQNGLIDLGLDVGDPARGRSSEATTRNLCNAVRTVLVK